MTLQELREKRAQTVANMEAVLKAAEDDGRTDLDADETELYASYEADLESIKAAISRKEALASEHAALEAITPAASQRHGIGNARAQGPEAKQEFSSLGEFMGAVAAHYRDRKDDPRLSWHDNANINAATQEMETGSSGGFLVPTQFRDTLLMVDPQQAIIEGRSNVMEAGSPPDAAVTMPALDQSGAAPDNVYGGVSVDWIGEGATKPETDATLREIELRPHELAAHVPMTDKLMRNAPAFSSQIEMMMRGALTSAKERAYLEGDGVAKPIGIINAGATVVADRATNDQISYADIVGMMAKLLMRGGSPYWLASQGTYVQLAQLQSPEGHLIWQQNAVDGSPGSLMGYPLFWHERSPALGSKGDLALVNTNPYYLIKPGSGPFVSMGYINTDFVQNRTRIKCFLNVDGQPWLTEPFTQENGYDVSPFVVLDA